MSKLLNKLPRLVQLLLLAAGLLLLNLGAQQLFFRLDLTADGRFSLSDVTKQTLDSLQKDVAVTVYLEGDFPPTVQRLQTAVRNHLQEMKAYAGSRVRFEFVNPVGDTAFYQAFAKAGIAPLQIKISQNELSQETAFAFPVVRIEYQGRETLVDLMKGTATAQSELEALAKAEQQLEYKLTAGLRRLVLENPYTVGIYTAPGAITREFMPYLLEDAEKLYQVVDVDLRKGTALFPSGYQPTPQGGTRLDVLLIAQPAQALTEREKYEIDQYLMRGGSVLWLLDNMQVQEADLNETGNTITQPRKLNLDDMFFKYGLKLNYDLVQDLNCGFIDAVQTIQGRDRIQPQRWVYFPLVPVVAPHPISRGLDQLLFRFAGTIDTLPNLALRRQVILTTSPYSRTQTGAVLINFNEVLGFKPPPEMLEGLGKGQQILGLAVSGTFQSVFTGREAPIDSMAATKPTAQFLANSSGKGKIVLFSDGALALANHSRTGNPGMPLDNKALLLNAIDYLIGDAALTEIRARDVRIRTLDRRKVLGHEGLIRTLAIGFPLLLVVGFGGLRFLQRRRKYGKHRA